MFDVEGFILVGGASSRMGKDKSRLIFDGRTSVEVIANALRPFTNAIRTVGARGASPSCDFPNVPDVHPQWGPLGGIQAALRASLAEYCLIVACDLIFVTSDLFSHLVKIISEKPVLDAIVPVQPDLRPQPLCAVYRREPALEAVEAAIEQGKRRPLDLLDRINTGYVAFAELAILPGSEHFFLNVNTPSDYERASDILKASQGTPQN
jgi:molybdopterin-guanine dinucleotide biosynthesis protein A